MSVLSWIALGFPLLMAFAGLLLIIRGAMLLNRGGDSALKAPSYYLFSGVFYAVAGAGNLLIRNYPMGVFQLALGAFLFLTARTIVKRQYESGQREPRKVQE